MPYKDKETQEEYQRQWYQKNRDRLLKKQSKYRKNNKEKIKESRSLYYKNNKDKLNKNRKKYYNKNRLSVLEILGGKCIYCGCNIAEALEINHINDGGAKEKRLMTSKQFYSSILNGERDIEDLELTCRVCNAWHYLIKLKGLKDGWTITYNHNI